MHDLLSTLFSEVQRESHQGLIGRQAHDQPAYAVLFGDGAPKPPARRGQVRALRAVWAAGALGVLLFVLAQF